MFSSVRFADENSGWIAGKRGIFYTSNGGESWKRFQIGIGTKTELMRKQSPQSFGKIIICNGDSALVWMSNAIVQVNGKTSQVSIIAKSDLLIKFEDLSLIDSVNGWATSGSEIYQTEDAGKTWKVKYKASFILRTVSAISRDCVWVAGLSDQLVSTEDGGNSWKLYDFKRERLPYFTKIYFFDASKGWLLGLTGLIKSYDSKMSAWKDLSSSVTHGTALHGISFADSNIGWIVGDTTIYYTRDGGQTWIEQEKHIKDVLLDVCALPYGRAWAVGTMGTVLRTPDYGKNWAYVDLIR